MADIFISYARKDRERAQVLAIALEDHGWSVWWDPQIPPGKTFDQVIETALDEAKCVVVLWSKESIGSDWVKEEAEEGKRRKILVPALIDGVNSPLGFKRIHAADLTDWKGDKAHSGFAGLLAAISEIVGPPVIEGPVRAQTESSEPENATVKPTEDKSDRETRLPVPEQQLISSVTPPTDGETEFKPSSVTVEEPKHGRRFVIGIGVTALVLIASVIFWANYSKKPSKPITTTPPAPEQQAVRQPAVEKKPEQAESFENTIGMEFVLIPAGTFAMGGGSGGFSGIWYHKDEHPSHRVEISRPFYLQMTEVTQGHWKKVMDDNPSSFNTCGDDCPVEQVSWDEAQKFVEKLNRLESTETYRLPTEAEWEYACRAGTKNEFFFGYDPSRLDEYAWYKDNSKDQTHPVGQKKANAWGLYDMYGNVWEWVEDDWHYTYDGAPADGSAWIDKPRGSDRPVRGCGWNSFARYCRSAFRLMFPPSGRAFYVGFRLAKSVALDH